MVISVYRLFLHVMVILSLWIMYANIGEDVSKFIFATLLFAYYLYQLYANDKSKKV
jgi:hypothetical protein